MALLPPLVIKAGVIQQLQSGDVLSVPVFSGGDVISLTNDNSGSIVIGTPVYVAANDHVDKAQANASATANCIGLVQATTIATAAAGNIQLNGILTATTGQWDAAFGTTGGLAKNTRYYLSAATAGLGTVTAPSTAGQLVLELGIAISTTEFLISIRGPILL